MTRSWQGFTPNQVVRRLGIIGPLQILILHNDFWILFNFSVFSSWTVFWMFDTFLSVPTHFLWMFLYFWILLYFECSSFASLLDVLHFLIPSLLDVLFSHEYTISFGCPFLQNPFWISLLSHEFEWFFICVWMISFWMISFEWFISQF